MRADGDVPAADGRQTWRPEAWRLRLSSALLMTLCFAGLAVVKVANGERLSTLLPVGGVLIGCLTAWDALRRRVEANDNGLWIVGLVKTRFVPWADITDLRGDAGDWSTKLVVVQRDGEVVNLPLTPTTHRSLVEHWSKVTAHHH